jgi:integrase
MPRRSPGEGTLFYSDSMKLWVAGYTVDGKQYRVTAKKRNDAISKRRDMKKQLDAGLVVGTGKVKVGVYLEDWLDKVHRYRAKPKTFREDTGVVKRHITPRIGDKRLDKLTANHVGDMIIAIQDQSPRNAQIAYRILSRALDDAVKRRILPLNPVAAIDKPNHTYAKHEAFTAHQALHIMATADQSCDEMWATRWRAGFMTGLREAELLGLEWDRVDLPNRRMHVTWQLQDLQKSHGCGEPTDGKYPCGKVRVSFCPKAHWDFPPGFEYRLCTRNLVWTKPKTQRSERGLPIIAPLRDALEQLQARGGLNEHGLVFHHDDGTPFTQSQDQKAWKALLIRAGVPHKPQHTLRRTTATLLRAAKVDEQTRMKLFGHASTDVQRLYAGDTWEQECEAMDLLTDVYTPQDLD